MKGMKLMKEMKSNQLKSLVVFIITLISFPTIASGGMILPSAVAFHTSIDPVNVTSLISCMTSIFITTIGVYAYKFKKDFYD